MVQSVSGGGYNYTSSTYLIGTNRTGRYAQFGIPNGPMEQVAHFDSSMGALQSVTISYSVNFWDHANDAVFYDGRVDLGLRLHMAGGHAFNIAQLKTSYDRSGSRFDYVMNGTITLPQSYWAGISATAPGSGLPGFSLDGYATQIADGLQYGYPLSIPDGGFQATIAYNYAAVPVPASLALMASAGAVFGLIGLRRRHRRTG